MDFTIHEDHIPLKGSLTYNTQDYAFNFVAESEYLAHGGFTLALGTLQIEVDIQTQFLLFPWGYYPQSGWSIGNLPQIVAKRGGIRVSLDEPSQPGMAVKLGIDRKWNTIYDTHTGWICICSDTNFSQHDNVEFAENVVLGVYKGQVAALWLKPCFLTPAP